MKNSSVSRRSVLAGLGAVSLATAVRARLAWAAEPPGPPVARIEPVAEALWGETIVDPYRWMEDDKDREWASFMQGQAEYARSVLDAIPGRRKLLERIAALSGDSSVTRSVQSGGGRIFYENRSVGASVFRICFRDGLAGAERVLVDPATIRVDGKHVSIDWWSVSPDGRHVAYGQSPAGSEMATTHVIEVDTGRLLPERIERTPFIPASWLPDSSGFFYSRLNEKAEIGSVDLFRDMVAAFHRLGTDAKSDLTVLTRGLHAAVPMEPFEIPILLTDRSSLHVVAIHCRRRPT